MLAHERFMAKVQKTNTCWLWTAAKNSCGYGSFGYKGKVWQAHRVAYDMFVGPIPPGALLDHTCHVRSCVRPSHLRLATNQENCQSRAGANSGRSLPRNVKTTPYGKFQVSVYHNGKQHYFGVYSTVEEAATRAKEAREDLFGEFAGRD